MNMPLAKKSLGQHFLRNDAVISRIADLIRIEPSDRVIEVGPGPGALTNAIRSRNPEQLWLIEKDDHWAAHHAGLEHPNERVTHGDALQFPWHELEGDWKIVGNLPYNVASPMMWDIVEKTPHLTRAVFMIQKEVGDRLCAAPNSRDYGALSVWIQSFVRVEKGFIVGPGNFSPPPKVDSAVVAFSPLAQKRDFEPARLSALLKVCFNQRRKQLQGILKKHGIADADSILESLGIAPTARPETLSPEQFHQLSRAISV